MHNNLFNYATSELSQDAFICWLLSYAMKDCNQNSVLSACARDFLHFFIPEVPADELYLSEPPCRQHKLIDVLITVNDKYKVIIEDKTHTSEHDNQLADYRRTVRKEFPDHTDVGVYYKIGFQSDLSNVYEAEYIVCDRDKILSILSKYIKEVNNSIFEDYYEYLKNFDEKANRFRHLPVNQWGWEEINGFYKYCKDNLTDTGMGFDYSKINNRSGGFYGMWIWKPFYCIADGLKCELYLQCEFNNGEFGIRFRASNKDGEKGEQKLKKCNRDALIRKCVDGKWIDISEKHNFTKPERLGSGKSVAWGVYNADINTFNEAVAAIYNAIHDFTALVDELNAD